MCFILRNLVFVRNLVNWSNNSFLGNIFLPSSSTASLGLIGLSDMNLSIDCCDAPPSLTLLR
nr:MAG TPA: hypothetical protein [Caudoviricetes sp.]